MAIAEKNRDTFRGEDEMLLLGPCKLLKIEGDNDKPDSNHPDRLDQYDITITTDKGIFTITGCSHCEAIFFEKEEDNGKTNRQT